MSSFLNGKRILLVISGSIAAIKAPDIIRLFRRKKADIRCLVTKGGAHFITPLALASLSGHPVAQDMWDESEESSIRHIRLAREADVIIVAPASADFISKMANGLANDLASTVILAADSPILVAPAMNHRMWHHSATQRNIHRLKSDGIAFIDPEAGPMACGETGIGRLADPEDIILSTESLLAREENHQSLKNRHFIVTAGPTYEPIDPVRYLANRSSGKQGFAIAEALQKSGAKVTLIAGPVYQATPDGVDRVNVETAIEMEEAVEAALPADGAIFTAAVADWRFRYSPYKYKKGRSAPDLTLIENPDILSTISHKKTDRPFLVIGFAAESEDLLENAKLKLQKKGCDWVIANSVIGNEEAPSAMGGDYNKISIISHADVENWALMSKKEIALHLVSKIADYFNLANNFPSSIISK
ncbi:bifunctional phosphopantothenoylcysteine decarboxylase/phosphopantothenate--cysteine ligase CoaBC [Zymomonas sp.]|uniref:bifunctional phosphopantothenoylcysteine decarboxylase/phosphopantothenate--cysteine ligase CoaBC n=1 Tax=Zymomonas sp. TaxID=2068624 RepID=UPI0025D2F8F1|nr:bifunctional phosphopantothenoylcysteine decarboxylase/phosphopantothenate--cysteine ligase CoaBC [Zymomonas sp.]MCA1955323.1 bifunctional phosphopantothenoylcysteine decarboxylase/phosphopantothenate--cysteine ligase CoaBC [Zymomonas sp.]